MRCPLCSGPVHADAGAFECEVGHRVDSVTLIRDSDLKLAEALRVARQALDNEADVLRAAGGADVQRFADEAEEQAKRLSEFASRHAPRVN